MKTMNLARRGLGTLAALFVVVAFSPAMDSPVADAAQLGDMDVIRVLLRDGADVNAAQGDGMTALHWAAQNSDADLAELLLFAGANPQPTTRLGAYTPLHQAARKGAADVVRVILNAGGAIDRVTTTGTTAMHFAAESGDAATVSIILERGGSLNAPDTYMGLTPLMFATAYNRLDVMKVLLAAGADLSATSLVVDYAQRQKDDGVSRRRRTRIVDAGKEPEEEEESDEPDTPTKPDPAPDTVANSPDTATNNPDTASTPSVAPDRSGGTAGRGGPGGSPGGAGTSGPDGASNQPRPLSHSDLVGKQGGFQAIHFAARDGRIEAVELLLEAGAEVDALTAGDESPPMLVAMINGNFDLGLILLDHGADPNLAGEDGAGPLFAVVNSRWAFRTWYPQPTSWRQQEADHLVVMERLLEAGADPNSRVETHLWYAAYNAGRIGVTFGGATPLWRAAYSLDVEGMKLLTKYGADPNIRTAMTPQRRFRFRPKEEGDDEDKSGLDPISVGDPAVHALHASSGVGYGTSRVGQQHVISPTGWLAAVTYLVDELGVDVNVRDHEGYSALHHAAARGDDEVIRFLVERGADVTLLSRKGQTTVDMANGPQQRVQPFPTTIALLEGYGAVNNHNCISC